MSDELTTTERLDRLLWKSVGVKTVRAIAEEVGLPVEDVMRRRHELTNEIDVLTVAQKQHKILVELEIVAQTIKDKLDSVSDERNFSGIANSFVNAMKTINAELRAMDKKNSAAVTQLNELRKREIVDMYVETVDAGVAELAEAHGINEDEVFAIFNKHLLNAAKRRDITA